MQLAKSIDDPYRVPSFAFVGTGVVSSGDSVSANATYTDAASFTRLGGLTVGPATTSYNYTFTAITNVNSLQRARDIYAYAVTAKENDRKPWFSSLTMKPPEGRWLYWDDMARPADANVTLGVVGGHTLWTDNLKKYNDFSLAVLNAVRTEGVFVAQPPRAGQATTSSAPPAAAGRSLSPGPSILLFPEGAATQ